MCAFGTWPEWAGQCKSKTTKTTNVLLIKWISTPNRSSWFPVLRMAPCVILILEWKMPFQYFTGKVKLNQMIQATVNVLIKVIQRVWEMSSSVPTIYTTFRQCRKMVAFKFGTYADLISSKSNSPPIVGRFSLAIGIRKTRGWLRPVETKPLRL